MLKYVLLGALNYQPFTGYQLKQFIDNTAKHFWYAQISQIYRTLDGLEKDGLLTSETVPQPESPDRRVYTITAAGRADLRTWLAQPMTEIAPTKDELLIRLFFASQLDKDTILTQLRLQRALHQQQLALLENEIAEQIRQGAARRPELAREPILWDATRRLGVIGEEAYIRWLDETIQRIEANF